jgi:hypothetical protein
MPHDDSRLYYSTTADDAQFTGRAAVRKLGVFKSGDESREERKEEQPRRAFLRDEL